MKNILKFFPLLAIVLTIVSCGSAKLPSKEIPLEYKGNSKNGMIVGSIAFDKKGDIFNGYRFYYKSMENETDNLPRNNHIRIIPEQLYWMKFNPDYFDGDRAIYFFKIDKPAGKYMFYAVSLFTNSYNYSSNQVMNVEIPFEIKEGKVTYLGELFFDKNIGLPLSDKSERDLLKLKEKFPNLKIEKE